MYWKLSNITPGQHVQVEAYTVDIPLSIISHDHQLEHLKELYLDN